MTEHWRLLARNYQKYSPPLRPNDETLTAIHNLVDANDPLSVVLGATPLFAGLGRRVWFVDVADDALRLVEPAREHRRIRKDWIDAAEEFEQADLIAGDAALNAVSSPAVAVDVLAALAAAVRPRVPIALRVFVQHELPPAEFRALLTSAFERKAFSEVRLLVYGIVAGADGTARIADADRFIAELTRHLPELDRGTATTFAGSHFEWRGISVEQALAVRTTMLVPKRARVEALFADAGLRVRTISPGTFPLAEFTPLYVATR
jgi:hypothetical protein